MTPIRTDYADVAERINDFANRLLEHRDRMYRSNNRNDFCIEGVFNEQHLIVDNKSTANSIISDYHNKIA